MAQDVYGTRARKWVRGHDARQVVFENCGHWLYLEQPDAFNRLVAEFAADGLSSVTFGSV